MSAHLTPATDDGSMALRAFSRAALVDAAARCISRRGDHRLRWAMIAIEAGNLHGADLAAGFEDLIALIDECYARSAQGLNDSLLRAETAPGPALDKLAAFLVAALETRRARGVFLSFRRGADLPPHLQRRLNEHDTAVRVRLKRLLNRGRRDGSLALRNLDSAVELLLASLQVPAVVLDGPEQRMWDSELIELLLAALAEPHPPEAEPVRNLETVRGSCLCAAVRYELDGPIDVMAHCQCSTCRKYRGTAAAHFISVPVSAFRWVAGENEVSTYESSDYGKRAFCKRCGSACPVADAQAGVIFCPADPTLTPSGASRPTASAHFSNPGALDRQPAKITLSAGARGNDLR